MERKHAPLKKRLSEWSNPWLIAIVVAFLLIGLPMVLWLMTYHSDAAVTMFIVTWISLTVFVVLMAKRTLLDPKYYVDKNIIDQTKREIEAHRLSVRRELLANEMQALRRGERTPVLDVWRLDESLAKRHPFFSSTTSLLIDPAQRELHVRIQIDEIHKNDDDKSPFSATFLNGVIGYLRVISQDPYLSLEKSFFDYLILEIDSVREDERHVDVPYAILSMLIDAVVFWSIKTIPAFDVKQLTAIGDVRFDDGNEIQPHRVIDFPSVRGMT